MSEIKQNRTAETSQTGTQPQTEKKEQPRVLRLEALETRVAPSALWTD